jgi:hypothetical protein
MMNLRKKRLAIAVAGVVSLGAPTAQATDFGASATLQNTLTVTSVLDFDVGSVFATVTGAALTNGVGAIVISPEGTVTDPTDSVTINLISLSTPVPAQGSIGITSDFTLTLPDTTAADPDDFAANAGTTLATITGGTANATELVHSSANPSVPSLFLMHFTIGDVSGGASTENNTYDGDFSVVQSFGETTYVFNIGATLTTEPTASQETYQEGLYSGTFAVTASY